jgi:arsenate reductase
MAQDRYNVLFLSNRNTARSIFAEAVMNRLGGQNFKGFSAGMHPAKELNPLVPEILRLARYPTDGLHPKSWQDFARADAPPLDFVFTLCDPDAGEPVPHWPGRPVTADWRYADPVRLKCEDRCGAKSSARCLPASSASSGLLFSSRSARSTISVLGSACASSAKASRQAEAG